jgi:hypothetical protein
MALYCRGDSAQNKRGKKRNKDKARNVNKNQRKEAES